MNCKRIQELILTDYSDGELSAQAMKRIDDHVAGCAACRAVAQNVRQGALMPFEGQKRAVPDPFIWRRIQTEIQKGTVPAHARVSTMDILAGFLGSFKPAAAVVAVFLVLVMAPVVNYHLADRPSYLTYLMDTDSEGGDEVTAGIEQYFL